MLARCYAVTVGFHFYPFASGLAISLDRIGFPLGGGATVGRSLLGVSSCTGNQVAASIKARALLDIDSSLRGWPDHRFPQLPRAVEYRPPGGGDVARLFHFPQLTA